MTLPVHTPGLSEHDIIVSTLNAAIAPQSPAPELQALLWDNAVWLAPRACLMQSHVPSTDAEPIVVQVVGVADYGDWAGAVLMLD